MNEGILTPENKKLVYKVAYDIKYRTKYLYDIEDLYQVGIIGLIKAYKKYNVRSPTKFTSFAYFDIFGEIYKYVKNDRNIRPSSENLRIYKSYLASVDSLAQNLKRPPSFSETASFMEINETDLAFIICSCEFDIRLENTIDIDTSIESFIGYDEREEVENRFIISESIKSLSEIEAKIIKLRYYDGYSQSETAKILNMSQPQISRKEDAALQMIKRNIAA